MFSNIRGGAPEPVTMVRKPPSGGAVAACVLSCGVTGCEYALASGGPHASSDYNCKPQMYCCWKKCWCANPWYPCVCFIHPCVARKVHGFFGVPFKHAPGW